LRHGSDWKCRRDGLLTTCVAGKDTCFAADHIHEFRDLAALLGLVAGASLLPFNSSGAAFDLIVQDR
jgi:hypothetical protein